MSIVDMSDETVKKIQSQLNQYLWSYKRARVKHTVLVGNMNEAGLRSIDVKCKRKGLAPLEAFVCLFFPKKRKASFYDAFSGHIGSFLALNILQ